MKKILLDKLKYVLEYASHITFTVEDTGEMRRLSVKLQMSLGWECVPFHDKSKRW